MLETAEVELRFDRVWRFDKHHAAWLKWLDVLMSISSPTRRSSRATHENRGDTISVPGAGETQWWGAGEVFFRVTACRTLFLFVAGQQVLQTEWTTMNRWCHESMNMMNLLVCFFNACYICLLILLNLQQPQIAQKDSHRRTVSVVRGQKLKQIHIRRTIRSPARLDGWSWICCWIWSRMWRSIFYIHIRVHFRLSQIMIIYDYNIL